MPQELIRFFVSPQGSDDWSGQQPDSGQGDGPLATLAAARDAVRAEVARGLSAPVEVVLRGGTYRPGETLVLGPEDSGTARFPVTWRAYWGEQPVVSGGRPVDGWRRMDKLPEALAEHVRPHVWVADVPAGQRFFTLYDGAGLLPRARSGRYRTVIDAEWEPRDVLAYRSQDLAPVGDWSDAELFIIPKHPWVVNYLPVANVDEERHLLRTAVPGTYPLTSHGGWAIVRSFYCIENVLQYLTEPGEWVLDTSQGRIYLWPRDGERPQGILYSGLRELIRIEGDPEESRWARHIHIRGLTFRHTERISWHEGRLGIQHDWDLFDAGYAAVRLRAARDVRVESCRFEQSGGAGVKLDAAAVGNDISHNEMRDLGCSGVSLVGYGPGARDEHHDNTVSHNHIHHCGLLWWHSPGIMICQSGANRIHNNLIHNMAYSGIVVVGGRRGLFSRRDADFIGDGAAYTRQEEIPGEAKEWYSRIGYCHTRHNCITHNEIHDVMQLLGDGNGIYVSGAGVGNRVLRNYVHDIVGEGCQSAIRLDDMQWYARVAENVVWRISGGGITLKHINDVENNIVVECANWGSILVRRSPAYGSNVRRNILVQSGRALTKPGAEPPFYDGGGFGGDLAEPAIDRNLLWTSKDPGVARACLQAMRERGQEAGSLIADPGFVDGEQGDFHLSDDSPALSLGIRPLEQWGLIEPVGPEELDE